MKTFTKQAAQGDLLIRRIDGIPDNVKEMQPEEGRFIVAHSETGHHHTLPKHGVRCFMAPDGMSLYAEVGEDVALEHHRPWSQHEGIAVGRGTYEIRRQREYTPQGFRRVED